MGRKALARIHICLEYSKYVADMHVYVEDTAHMRVCVVTLAPAAAAAANYLDHRKPTNKLALRTSAHQILATTTTTTPTITTTTNMLHAKYTLYAHPTLYILHPDCAPTQPSQDIERKVVDLVEDRAGDLKAALDRADRLVEGVRPLIKLKYF